MSKAPIVKKNIVLIGGGGHCQSCIDVIELEGKYRILGILDNPGMNGQKILNYDVIGSDNHILELHQQGCAFLITIGQIKSALIRRKIFRELKQLGATIATIISPLAYVSRYATVGEGSIIMHNSFVNAGVTVGENCILNTGCVIEHNAIIGNHTHISTNAIVNGGSHVGDETFIGSNATISNRVSVGRKIIVGAGSLIITSTGDNETWVGVPAKKINV